MRLLNYFPHPKYFFIAGFIGIPISFFLLFATFREQISSYYPYWSPDGNKLAFLAEEDNGDYEIFVIDADGHHPVQLTTQVGVYIALRWSADNTSIYYQLAPYSNTDTWYRIRIYPQQYTRLPITGNYGVDPYQNPIASEAEIEASVGTNSESDRYYATNACNSPLFQAIPDFPLDECEKTLEVYSVETDELIWSFGKFRYNLERYGFLGVINFVAVFFGSVFTICLGIVIAILRRFKKPDKRKS